MLEDAGTRVKFVLHDRDVSLTASFDEVFRTAAPAWTNSGKSHEPEDVGGPP